MGLRDEVIKVLKTVIDPEVNENVWDLKLVYDLEVDEEKRNVSLKFKPTVPYCPIGLQLALQVKQAIRTIKDLNNIDMLVTDFVMADQANEYLKQI